MIIKNFFPFEQDTRVKKISEIIGKGNYELTLIGWNKKSHMLYSVKRINNESYKSIIMQTKRQFANYYLIFFPIWWLFILKNLLKMKWDIVHVINLPSLIPSILVAKIKRKSIVYDLEDITHSLLPVQLNILSNIILLLERFLMKFVNAVILIDECLEILYIDILNSNIKVIYDSPKSYINSSKITKNTSFNLFYAGFLTKKRNLNIDLIIEAIKDMENVNITFAGVGDLVEDIKNIELEMPNKVKLIGWIPYHQVIEMTYNADLIFSLRDPTPVGQKYICGSKFLEAIMCGKPILVNKGTSTAIKVKKHKCGLVVDAHNPEKIKEAILKLKNDKELSKKLGINGRKAYDERYNWKLMRQRLLNLYSKVLI